jgi:hypothetical protein
VLDDFETRNLGENDNRKATRKPTQNAANKFPVLQPNIYIKALTGESEKLIGNVGRKALVTLVTCEASKLQRTASYTGMRDNDVSQERSD